MKVFWREERYLKAFKIMTSKKILMPFEIGN